MSVYFPLCESIVLSVAGFLSHTVTHSDLLPFCVGEKVSRCRSLTDINRVQQIAVSSHVSVAVVMTSGLAPITHE